LTAMCCVFAAAQSGGTSDAQKPADEGPVITLKANTRVVLLDVVVTDKQGVPITDLSPDDLKVFENGKPQKTVSFGLMDKASAAAAAKASAPPQAGPGYYSNYRGLAEQGQITVLLVDGLNWSGGMATRVAGQVYGRWQLLKYVDRHHGERLAVFGLTGSLNLLQDFTDDPEKLHKAIEKWGAEQALHPDDDLNVADDPGAINAYLNDFSTTQTNIKNSVTLDALQALGRWLAGYPGRKKLVWIGGEFPVQLDGDLGRFTTADPFIQKVKETATLLTDAQISVYMIDATGLKVDGSYIQLGGGGTGTNGMVFGTRGGTDLTQVTNGQSALSRAIVGSGSVPDTHQRMNRFAEQTGGLAIYNKNDLDNALGRTLADGQTYYAVSYSPEDKRWDGNYRKLEIKTNRPGLQLRYRRGYYALDPNRAMDEKQTQVDSEIRKALVSPLLASGISFYGSARSSDVDAKAPVQTVLRAEGRTALQATDVIFRVDPRNILFEQLEDGQQHCNVTVFVGVYSGRKLVAHAQDRLDGKWKPEALAQMVQRGGMSIHLELNVPNEKVRLRLLMRDNRSGKIGALDVPYLNEVAAK
jgi:VWFA-related protein